MSAAEKYITLKCTPNAFIVNYKKQDGSLVSDSVNIDWIGIPSRTDCTDRSIFSLNFGNMQDYTIFNIGQYKGFDINGPMSSTDRDSVHASVDTTYLMINQRGYIMTKE